MKTLSKAAFDRAAVFLASKGRPLELWLFRYHFSADEGARDAVKDILKGYQNPDGGFGNALEPDVRMADSSVVATKFALQILLDVSASGEERLVQDGIAYLLKTYCSETKTWRLATRKVMDAPHAPWWDYDGLESEFGCFLANPRAGILRCLLSYPELSPIGFADEIIASLMAHFETLPIDMAFFDAISFLQLLQVDDLSQEHRDRLLPKLRRTGRKIVDPNPDNWNRFAVKPLWLAPAPTAPLVGVLRDDIQKNLDFEIENQNPDGSWSPTWSWAESNPENWAIAEREWKGILTLATLRSLRDFGRINGHAPEDGRPLFKYHLD